VKINNKLHGPRLSYRGVCQGGILSPLLYILYIHRLNEILGSDITIKINFMDLDYLIEEFVREEY
jgi:hypothetical protein